MLEGSHHNSDFSLYKTSTMRFDIQLDGYFCYRTAVVLGTGVPLVMFLVWNAVILGTNSSLIDSNGAIRAISDPLMRLPSASGIVGVSSSCAL
jgi:hypothetical protein